MTPTELAQEELETASTPFADVPAAGREAELDPNWVDLRGGAVLPALYMPPSMPGRHPTWLRWVAVGLVGVFVAATAAGICLTYGAPYSHF